MYNTTVQKALKEIPRLESFEQLLSESTLNELDKEILRMHYLDEKDFSYIADSLGYSESGIKKRHGKALKKLSSII